MVKAVQDVHGGLCDSIGSEQILNHMVAEQQHELLSIKRRNRFEAAVRRPDAPGSDGVNMRTTIPVSCSISVFTDIRQSRSVLLHWWYAAGHSAWSQGFMMNGSAIDNNCCADLLGILTMPVAVSDVKKAPGRRDANKKYINIFAPSHLCALAPLRYVFVFASSC
jgi:hypothetical protein